MKSKEKLSHHNVKMSFFILLLLFYNYLTTCLLGLNLYTGETSLVWGGEKSREITEPCGCGPCGDIRKYSRMTLSSLDHPNTHTSVSLPSADASSMVQVKAELHNSLDTFASCLAKAIESDAKFQIFGEETLTSTSTTPSLLPTLPGALFTSRNLQRGPRSLDGQRLRMESIDEGIVKDDQEQEDENKDGD